jgi:hypothetical protein
MKLKLFAATAALALVTVAPTLADEYPVHRRHHRHHHHVSYWPLPYPISYLHNYGPGPVAGTFAFYDGPTSRLCKQGAAAYIGQDGRRHPCF